jgi:hypothetical protein
MVRPGLSKFGMDFAATEGGFLGAKIPEGEHWWLKNEPPTEGDESNGYYCYDTEGCDLYVFGNFGEEEPFWKNVGHRDNVSFVEVPLGFYSYNTADVLGRLAMGTDRGLWIYNQSENEWEDRTDRDNELGGSTFSHVIMRNMESGAIPPIGDADPQNTNYLYTILINGQDTPKAWNNLDETKYEDMENAPTASVMLVCANRLVMANLSAESAQTVDRSDPLNPFKGWGQDLVILGDTPGPIVAGREMGNLQFVLYKTDATYLAQAQGGSAPFAYYLKSAYNSGPLSNSCVISSPVDGTHWYLAIDGGINRFDGTSTTQLGEQSRAFVYANLDIDQRGLAFAFADARTNFAWFFYPRKGVSGIDSVLLVDMNSGTVWPFRFPGKVLTAAWETMIASGVKIGDLNIPISQLTKTIGEFSSQQPNAIFGAWNGAEGTSECYLDFGDTDDGDSIPFFWESGLDQCGTSGYKTVTSSDHRFVPTVTHQSIIFSVGFSNHGEIPVFDNDPQQSFDISEEGPHELGHRVTGRSIAVRFEGNASEAIVWDGSVLGIKA